jgi:hypothetical protein
MRQFASSQSQLSSARKRFVGMHEGLVMDMGQFTVTSRGGVGADGSLAMLVEVALRGDLAGQTPG